MNINTKHTKRRWVPRCYFFFVNNELEIIFPSFPTSNSFKLVWSCLYPGCSVPVSGNISISYPISGNEWIWIFYIKALNFWEPNVFSTSLQPTDDNIHVIWEVGTRGRRKRVNQLETRAFYSKPDMKETFDDRETITSKGLVPSPPSHMGGLNAGSRPSLSLSGEYSTSLHCQTPPACLL